MTHSEAYTARLEQECERLRARVEQLEVELTGARVNYEDIKKRVEELEAQIPHVE